MNIQEKYNLIEKLFEILWVSNRTRTKAQRKLLHMRALQLEKYPFVFLV